MLTEKASLISKKSTADCLIPACERALGMARDGDVVNFSGHCARRVGKGSIEQLERRLSETTCPTL